MTASEKLVSFRSMEREDLGQVLAIERRSFPVPWTAEQFLGELDRESVGWNRILELDRVAGYGCSWIVAGEMQINNIAVHLDYRGAGWGSRLLEHLLEEASRRNCAEVILEVARSNRVARRMYESRGFLPVGVRDRYYQVTGDDALVLRLAIGSCKPQDL